MRHFAEHGIEQVFWYSRKLVELIVVVVPSSPESWDGALRPWESRREKTTYLSVSLLK